MSILSRPERFLPLLLIEHFIGQRGQGVTRQDETIALILKVIYIKSYDVNYGGN